MKWPNFSSRRRRDLASRTIAFLLLTGLVLAGQVTPPQAKKQSRRMTRRDAVQGTPPGDIEVVAGPVGGGTGTLGDV